MPRMRVTVATRLSTLGAIATAFVFLLSIAAAFTVAARLIAVALFDDSWLLGRLCRRG